MIVNLLIMFLLAIDGIQSEDQENEDGQFLKLIADKICVGKQDKKVADKVANCENLVKPTV